VPTTTEETPGDAAGTASETGDRRRAGRAEAVSTRLIPLLRGRSADGSAASPGTPASDAVGRAWSGKPGLGPRALRGIALGVLFAIPLWIALGLLVAWIVRSH
jgi:hypothetical protein